MSQFRITGNKGFHITFDNGYTVSIQFGAGNYCDNYNSRDYSPKEGMQSSTAEIAYWKKDSAMIEFEDSNDTVKGYQTVKDVMEFLNQVMQKE